MYNVNKIIKQYLVIFHSIKWCSSGHSLEKKLTQRQSKIVECAVSYSKSVQKTEYKYISIHFIYFLISNYFLQ